jgi:hypothetical protein
MVTAPRGAPMNKLELSLPTAMYERLKKRADRLGKSPEEFSTDILEAALRDEKSEPRTTREILEADPETVSLSEELRNLIVPGITLQEVQALNAAAGGPSLSDIVIEQRGAKI